MLDDDTIRQMGIDLANRFNAVIMEFDAGIIEAVVVRGIAYMIANNALGSNMTRDQLVDMLGDLNYQTLNGYDLDLARRRTN